MIIDLHCDTIKKAYEEKIDLWDKRLQFNLKSLKKMEQYIQVFAIFIDADEQENGYEITTNVINNFYDNLYNDNKMKLIIKGKDIEKDLLRQKLGIILSIENGSAISGNLENIDKLYQKGIRIMSVVWNEDNDLACGAHTKNDTGLTELGKLYVEKLIQKNILIDVSHSSYKTFWDIVKIAKNSVIIATHSNCQGLCNNSRNLDDEQIKQIANLGGLIGITYVNSFLKEKEAASSINIVNHIDYIVNLVGIDYVALGSDFDGVNENQKPVDVKCVSDVKKIIIELEKRGYTKKDIEKITSGNFIRVMKNL